ncbi:MAG: hypothetical protein AVDCRST_MAG32-1358 [uncultured Nocardioides sp.]|uniref:Uncharacterized protein n=1 Tax=uncultured Nocardioides sp. TaxID=198441 RepID=A0A6J4N9I3_9ACTN|nr:MAG: hypothetical protein AVDCRST_MAG32-1358 [uncultured Nocardioides sp.]
MLDLLIVALAAQRPDDADVKAGPMGFAVFVFLILAVAVIGWSLTRQLRKAQAAKDAGVYGDDPAPRDRTDD